MRASSSRIMMAGKKILLIQNKGGGHGEIGYQVCKTLLAEKEVDITLVQDDAAKEDKLPFSCYGELEAAGVKIVPTSLDDKTLTAADLGGETFDYIIDNWSKSNDDFNFVKSLLIKPESLEQYLFVSSAGMYLTGSGLQPHIETDEVKADNGPRTVEVACEASGLPYTFMRPQYIYGPKMSKRHLDYYLGRAMRQLPIPIPMSGEQLVCLTHSEDVASLIVAALGHPAAMNEAFNCGSDRFVSYMGLAELINEACGNAASTNKYLFFDPKDFDGWSMSDPVFPFRRDTFITSVDKAKVLLGWAPAHTLEDDVGWILQDYAETGGLEKPWTEKDLKCDLEILASKDHQFMFTYPFFDDESVNPESMPYSFESSSEFSEK